MRFEEKAILGLKRLPRLPPHVWDDQGVEREPGDQRKSPFRGSQNKMNAMVADMLKKKIDEKYGSYRTALKKSPIKFVRFSSLCGLQAGVNADIVKKKILELAKTDTLEAPTVARYKGRMYLMDGYHSLTALKLGGVRKLRAVVIEI